LVPRWPDYEHVSIAERTVTGNQVHTWVLHRHADLAYVIERLLPHLVIKGDQARAMLQLVRHPQRKPAWTSPTAKCSRTERARRRRTWDQWREIERRLRLAVPAARRIG